MNNLERDPVVQLDRQLYTKGLMTAAEKQAVEEEAAEMAKKSLIFAGKRILSAKIGPLTHALAAWRWLRDLVR